MKNLKNDLKNGIIKNLYLFCGAEVYLRDIYSQKLISTILSGDFVDMNLINLRGNDVTYSQIDDAMLTLPFMAEKRVVFVKDSMLFSDERKEEGKKIVQLFDEVPETTVLIFVERDVTKTLSPYKQIAKKGMVVSFEMPKPNELINWVKAEFKKNNIEISMQTADYFINSIEYNMSAFNLEISKLSSYALKKGIIENDDIDLICTKTAESKIFTLLDNVVEKNTSDALKMYNNLLANKESPIMVLAMISRQFRNILRCRDLEKEGNTISQIAEKLEMKEYPVKKCLSQGKKFKMKDIVEILKECLEFDNKIKTGLLNEKIAVEILIIKYSSI